MIDLLIILACVGGPSAILASFIGYTMTPFHKRRHGCGSVTPLSGPSCAHREAVEVHASYSVAAIAIYGPPAETLVAWHCPDCDEQMPAEWRQPAGIDEDGLNVWREPKVCTCALGYRCPRCRPVDGLNYSAELYSWASAEPIRRIEIHDPDTGEHLGAVEATDYPGLHRVAGPKTWPEPLPNEPIETESLDEAVARRVAAKLRAESDLIDWMLGS